MSVSDAIGTDVTIPKFSSEELLGLTLTVPMDDGEQIRAKVVQKINDRQAQDYQQIKFLLSCGDGDFEQIVGYNELSDMMEQY